MAVKGFRSLVRITALGLEPISYKDAAGLLRTILTHFIDILVRVLGFQ